MINNINQSKMVKLKPDTVEALRALRIAKRESYDEVINRLFLQFIAEEELELGNVAKKIISDRINNVRSGNVKSFNEILCSLKNKKEVAAEKRGKENKLSPGRDEIDAAMGG